MTRRSALVAVGMILAGHLGRWDQSTVTAPYTPRNLQPEKLTFHFGELKTIEFKHGDRTVTVTPKEIMDALEGK